MSIGLGIRSFWDRDPIPIFDPKWSKCGCPRNRHIKVPIIYFLRHPAQNFKGNNFDFHLKSFLFLSWMFLANISKNVRKMSKKKFQKWHGRWFGGSTWRSTGLNESVWSPGTPRGLPGAFWAPRGPTNVFFWFLGVGGGSRLASLLALSLANRPY